MSNFNTLFHFIDDFYAHAKCRSARTRTMPFNYIPCLYNKYARMPNLSGMGGMNLGLFICMALLIIYRNIKCRIEPYNYAYTYFCCQNIVHICYYFIFYLIQLMMLLLICFFDDYARYSFHAAKREDRIIAPCFAIYPCSAMLNGTGAAWAGRRLHTFERHARLRGQQREQATTHYIAYFSPVILISGLATFSSSFFLLPPSFLFLPSLLLQFPSSLLFILFILFAHV